MTDESALTIAGKRRHLLLLQKVRENKPLSRREIAELQQYEESMGKRTEKTEAVHPKRRRVRHAGPGGRSEDGPGKQSSPALTSPQVRLAGLECATMAEAETRLGVEDLAGRLEGNKRLAQAWEKGRRLRDIRELAATPICLAEASQRLGMGENGLAKLCKRDPEVRDLWDRARVGMVVEAKRGIMEGAAAGKQHAIAALEQILQGEFARPAGGRDAADFARLTPTQMEAATGFNHRQILRWHKKHGLPRNRDNTYSLPAFVAWHWQFELDKRTRGPGTAGQDPLREQKARKARVEADLAEGRVVPFEVHERGYLERGHILLQLLNETRAEEWAALHEGLTALQLKEKYMDAFTAVQDQYCKLVDDAPQLPAAVKAKLEEAFALLKDGRNHQ